MLFAKRAFRFLLPVLLFVGLFLAWVQREAIYDWWRLRGYTPPTVISQLASHDTMTGEGRHLFYINHPELITNKATFQQACTQTEQTIVLGCYMSMQRGINIFDVTDERLAGVEEVTAAHEMLHAAYDRLSSEERQQVDGWLQDYYKHSLKDKRVIATINSYKKTEPNDVVNEMHSVFGTEIGKLPAQLENYYKRYFTKRSSVVAYSQKYEEVFTSRQEQAEALYGRLQVLLKQINNLQASLSAQQASLNADRGNLNSQAEANAFNARVRSYNAGVETLNSLVDQYNELRDQYNVLVLQQQQLLKAIDTRSTQKASAQ